MENALNSIKIKRPVLIKTIITQKFKDQALEDLNKEIQLIESQIMHLEIQNRQIQDQILGFSSAGSNNPQQIQQTINEINEKLNHMTSLKQELISERENITHLALNNHIVTGSLENYVELKIGENIYEKFKNAEIIVKDGIIQEIKQ